MKMYKINIDGTGLIEKTIEGAISSLQAFLEDAEPYEEFCVKVIVMDEEDFEKLPEWSGP